MQLTNRQSDDQSSTSGTFSGKKAGGHSFQGVGLGRADDFIIRTIAAYKAFKSVLAFALAIYIFFLIRQQQPDILRFLAQNLNIILENKIMQWLLNKAAPFIDQHIRSIDFIIILYACIYLAEGVGLFLRKTWAEYLVIVETCIPLPFELYEMYSRVALWNVGVFIGNIFVLFYLVRRIHRVHLLQIGQGVSHPKAS